MQQQLISICRSAKTLTLVIVLVCSGCSYVGSHFEETCNSHAYTQIPLAKHISSRFGSRAPVRMAVIPFSAPANITSQNSELPGVGNKLAWRVQAELLTRQAAPIVEVFNREDWPGKKDEFFTGNFGALSLARQAGYDIIVVGMVDHMMAVDNISVFVKMIEVDSGMTLYYGKLTVDTMRDDYNRYKSRLGVDNQTPSLIFLRNISDELGRCIADELTADKAVPE